MVSMLEFIKHPNPKISAQGIERRARNALKGLQNANKGANAERTGLSSQTLFRMNTK